jgi:hypothetical protein
MHRQFIIPPVSKSTDKFYTFATTFLVGVTVLAGRHPAFATFSRLGRPRRDSDILKTI